MDKTTIWALMLKNIIVILIWGALAVLFDKWWIALFAIFFMSYVEVRHKSYRVCDGCGKHSPYANSYNKALDKAKKAGWVHYVDGNRDYCPECIRKEKDEIQEVCRKFSEKYEEVRCKFLKMEMAPLSCEEGFVYSGDRTFCLKKDRELLDLFECVDCEYKEKLDGTLS